MKKANNKKLYAFTITLSQSSYKWNLITKKSSNKILYIYNLNSTWFIRIYWIMHTHIIFNSRKVCVREALWILNKKLNLFYFPCYLFLLTLMPLICEWLGVKLTWHMPYILEVHDHMNVSRAGVYYLQENLISIPCYPRWYY